MSAFVANETPSTYFYGGVAIARPSNLITASSAKSLVQKHVDAIEADYDTFKSRVLASWTAQLAKNTSMLASIGTLQTDVASNASAISTVNTSISTLESNFQSAVETVETDVAQLQTDVLSHNTRISNVESTVGTHTNDIALLQSHLGSLQTSHITDIGSLQNQINSILNNVDGTALNSLAEIVDAFQQADGTLQGAISSLTIKHDSELGAVDSRVTSLENSGAVPGSGQSWTDVYDKLSILWDAVQPQSS